jgi:hypothetical protein
MYRSGTRLFVVSSVFFGPRLFVGPTLLQLDSLSLRALIHRAMLLSMTLLNLLAQEYTHDRDSNAGNARCNA